MDSWWQGNGLRRVGALLEFAHAELHSIGVVTEWPKVLPC